MRHRKSTIRIALLISVAIHGAVFLWVRFDPFSTAPPIAIPTIEVTLIATPPVDEPDPEPAVPESLPVPEDPQSSQVLLAPPEPSPAPATSTESAELSDPIDWEDIISTFAEEATIRNLEQEDQRAAMWRKTFSVMFKPPEDWLIEDEPYLPDLQFEADKPKRLGIKISENCYLGLPEIDPQTVDSDGPAWNSGGTPAPTVNLISCEFGG